MIAHGPHDPSTSTPDRRPGSVRRTTSLDIQCGFGIPLRFTGQGRDLRTGADGSAEVVAEVVVDGTIAVTGELAGISTTSGAPVERLIGGSVRKGFRYQVAAALPDERDQSTLLHQLLDDLPITLTVSGYGEMRAHEAIPMTDAAMARITDVCAGWQRGATMMDAYEATDLLPMPVGPPAPELTSADPLAWHDLAPLEEGVMRRRRRIDVIDGAPLEIDAMFHDSHRPVGSAEDVLHEYQLVATIDRDGTVLAATATPRVLPWPECPQAVASAGRVVGRPAATLRPDVLAELTGIETCTHLNDTLRALADVPALAGAATS